jgi:hypothetical protein
LYYYETCVASLFCVAYMFSVSSPSIENFGAPSGIFLWLGHARTSMHALTHARVAAKLRNYSGFRSNQVLPENDVHTQTVHRTCSSSQEKIDTTRIIKEDEKMIFRRRKHCLSVPRFCIFLQSKDPARGL